MSQSFDELCHWLELEGGTELYTLSELHDQLKELASGSEVYTIKRLKQRLIDHYKDVIFFAEVGGRHNVVCFRNMANYIINEKWYTNRRDTVEDETERIVKTAARLIQAQIRETEYSLASYPSNDEIKNINSNRKQVPQLLQSSFLKTLIVSELKQISIVLLLGDLIAFATWLANPSLLTSYISPDGTRGFCAHIFEKMVIIIQICHLLK